MSATLRIEFPALGKEVRVDPGASVADACAAAGRPVPLVCGGNGTCGKCLVSIEQDGRARDVLACREPAQNGMRILIAPPTPHGASILTESSNTIAALKPGTQKTCIRKDALPDIPCSGLWQLVRKTAKLDVVEPNLRQLRQLADIFQQPEIKELTLALDDGCLLTLEAGDTTTELYGLAVDLGTTTIAAYAYSLATGEEIAVRAGLNSQAELGADVISRIQAACDPAKPEALDLFRKKAVKSINKLIEQMPIPAGQIYTCVLCGNSAMQHLFLGLSPKSLGRAPFHAVNLDEVLIPATELELDINPDGSVRFLPLIGGFVGADTLACALALGMHQQERPRLIIDIGTNCELIVGTKHKMLAASAAAGPAFEGAEIACGMSALTGAVSEVNLSAHGVACRTIGEAPPLGLCGSALVDALAELLRHGLVTPRGRLLSKEDYVSASGHPALAERLDETDGERRFILVRQEESGTGRTIFLSQKDIRALQLAKGAIRAAYTILLERLELVGEDLEEISICGAFGTHLNIPRAQALGLVPDFSGVPVRAAGNAAGAGARMALLSVDALRTAHDLHRNIEHVELASEAAFSKVFMHSLNFDGNNS